MENEVYFHHFHVMDGRCTAAFTLDPNREAPQRVLTYALSYCSSEDNFEKAEGRKKAAGKLVSMAVRIAKGRPPRPDNPTHVVEFDRDEKLTVKEQVIAMLQAAAEENIPVAWVKRQIDKMAKEIAEAIFAGQGVILTPALGFSIPKEQVLG